MHEQRRLWRGVYGARPVRALLITEPGQPDLALVTTDMTTPSYADMIGKLRRVLIAAQYLPEVPYQPTPDEIRAVHLAWAQAAA